jgi:hypothetical protein
VEYRKTLKFGFNEHNYCLKELISYLFDIIYRVIQDELPPLTELISDDILSKKCHINLCPLLNIYRVTFVFGIFLNFNFNVFTSRR